MTQIATEHNALPYSDYDLNVNQEPSCLFIIIHKVLTPWASGEKIQLALVTSDPTTLDLTDITVEQTLLMPSFRVF